MIKPDKLMQMDIPAVIASHTARDTILYALGLGLGFDPTDPWHLQFVTEANLKAVPTMGFVLAWHGNWMTDYETGIDYSGVVDGERSITIHSTIPIEGATRSKLRIVDVIDKGEGRGALVLIERELTTVDGKPIATMTQTVFARKNGGFGGPDRSLPRAPDVPSRSADAVVEQQSTPQQALIYRLSGDYNPLHSDPDVARRAGFDRPILHGLSTLGMAATAIMRSTTDSRPGTLTKISARFSAPVLPGETLRTEIWRTDETIQFRTAVVERGAIVLSGGQASVA